MSFILIYLNLSLSSVAPSRRLPACGAPELLAMSPRLASLLLWRASCHPGPALLTSIRRRYYLRPEVSRARHVVVELPACHAGHGHGASVRHREPAPSSKMVQSTLPRVIGKYTTSVHDILLRLKKVRFSLSNLKVCPRNLSLLILT